MAYLKFNTIHLLCYVYPFACFSRESLIVIGYEVLTAPDHGQDTILHMISHSKDTAYVGVRLTASSSIISPITTRFINRTVKLNETTWQVILNTSTDPARFNPDVSATCKFCNVPSKDISHLLMECTHKWSIWHEAMSRFAPHLDFQPTDILALLLHLTRFDYIDNTTLLRLSYYILLFLWRAHWRYIFDAVPLLSERIVTTAFEKIGTFSLH
ncbi:hypothetical protein G6F46_003917 [Rhizopus delemar]|uniref:Reverse transcriptase zinc-binding domain-containing protein n=2 Tax=Rhizopus TaxID=4842 RepID=A0A9P6Z7Y6_9FUNG|nr:hypothetical protein G6F55_003374 [Rhizopus delemar]KAG1547749.1 hypothetical protein G6F51_004077 [Rhizopus arrhizus]KAG1501059.1 hypothetical protein G6F54_003305 [Rhizopus delemar]KAG1514697.1 hypothetical protein G6F53_003487 [Rhizopus delemar]KAG1518644.1 hypothetical protein G6F52_008981 [Rhizopus delemar]